MAGRIERMVRRSIYPESSSYSTVTQPPPDMHAALILIAGGLDDVLTELAKRTPEPSEQPTEGA